MKLSDINLKLRKQEGHSAVNCLPEFKGVNQIFSHTKFPLFLPL